MKYTWKPIKPKCDTVKTLGPLFFSHLPQCSFFPLIARLELPPPLVRPNKLVTLPHCYQLGEQISPGGEGRRRENWLCCQPKVRQKNYGREIPQDLQFPVYSWPLWASWRSILHSPLKT